MGCSRPGSSCRSGSRLGEMIQVLVRVSGHNVLEGYAGGVVHRVTQLEEDALLRSAEGAWRAGWRVRGEEQAANSKQW